MCYSSSARENSSDIKELFNYFHSRLSDLFDLSVCFINMHLLLHLGDQIASFGALPNISMFTFEHQFQTFKLFSQGSASFFKQICDKIFLLKHCTSFLCVFKYADKEKILSLLSDCARTDAVKFIDEGHVLRNGIFLYSQKYARIGAKSTVYTAIRSGEMIFVKIQRFFLDPNGDILVNVQILRPIDTPVFTFTCNELSSVPRHVINIVNKQIFYHTVQVTDDFLDLQLSDIVRPCVVMKDFDFDVDRCILLIPCDELSEYH